MNKNVKGGIAVGAGLLLLLGGGGTFALWNTSAQVNAGTVTTGHLTAGAFTGSWKDQNNVAFNPATDYAVPGDTLTYTATSALSANGSNLEFTAFIAPSALTSLLAGGWVVDDQSISVTGGSGFTAASSELGADYSPTGLPTNIDVIGLSADTATGTLNYTLTITFGDDEDADADNGYHDSVSTLTNLTLTVQQVFES